MNYKMYPSPYGEKMTAEEVDENEEREIQEIEAYYASVENKQQTREV